MNATLIRALVASAPVGVLLWFSIVVFARGKTLFSFVQLVGAGCLTVVVLTHVCEGLRLFPWMRWGEPRSAGHYVDVSSAVLGLTLFPLGYVLHRRERAS